MLSTDVEYCFHGTPLRAATCRKGAAGAFTAVTAAVFVCAFSIMRSQPPGYSINSLTTREGLSQNYVYTILEDSRGFMWFGTRDGLNRYDGTSFRHYRRKPFDENSLPHNTVMALAEDRWGTLWIGTDGGGICAYDRWTDTYMRLRGGRAGAPAIDCANISALAIGPRDVMYIGTRDRGIEVLDLRAWHTARMKGPIRGGPDRTIHIPEDTSSSAARNILAVTVDKRGTPWAADYFSIIRLSPDGFVRKRYPWTKAGKTAQRLGYSIARFGPGTLNMHFHTDGKSEIGTVFENEIVVYDTIADDFRTAATVGPPWAGFLLGILEENSASWTVLRNNSIYVISKRDQRVRHYPLELKNTDGNLHKNALSVLTIFRDSKNIVWLGTDRGILRYCATQSPFNIHRTRREHGIRTGPCSVRALFRNREGEIFCGTVEYGVRMLEEASGNLVASASIPDFPLLPRFAPLVLNSVLVDGAGNWLAASRGGFVFVPRGSDGKPGKPRFIGPHANLFTVERSAGSVFWLGGEKRRRGVLYRYDAERGSLASVEPKSEDGSPPFGNGVWKLHAGGGFLWIGAENGLHRYDLQAKSWRKYENDESNPASLIHNEIWSIADKGDGKLWLGTSGGGLEEFDKRTELFRHHNTESGLAADMVADVQAALDGRLWLSTSSGISCYDPVRDEFRNYSDPSIDAALPFNLGSGMRAGDGGIYFGGGNGLLSFHPDSLKRAGSAPRIVLTSVAVEGMELRREFADRDTLLLPSDRSSITISFSTLDFDNPGKSSYRYRIEGWSRKWIYTGNRRYVSFPALAPGDYPLRVCGGDGEGVWNEAGITLMIRVLPPYYATWWFRALCAAAVLLSVVAAAAARQRHLREKNARERRAIEAELLALRLQMNPHFFFNALTAIQNFIAGSDEAQANDYIAKFARLMRLVLESSRQPSIPLRAELEAVSIYLELESVRFNGRFRHEIVVDDGVDPEEPVPSMLIQPFVENAVRHGLQPMESGGRLLVRIRSSGGDLICTVEDNGIGRAKSMELRGRHAERREHLGSSIAEERIAVLNEGRKRKLSVGILDMRDASGIPAGTRVTITIPLE